MRSIRTGKEDHVILTFSSAYKELKESIKRGAELSQVLTEPRLHDIRRARHVLDGLWPFLREDVRTLRIRTMSTPKSSKT